MKIGLQIKCQVINVTYVTWEKLDFYNFKKIKNKTKDKEQNMKRILAIVMSLVVVLGVCVVGTGCDPNKETEAEYKARIKKELDEIPIEATGYKLVHLDLNDTPSYEYVEPGSGGVIYEKIFDERIDINVCEKNGSTNEDYGFYISVDGEEKQWVSFNYNLKYNNFGRVYEIAYLDKNVFFIRRRAYVGLSAQLSDFFPPTLFCYDYDTNSLKYMGYYDNWFNGSVFDANYRHIAVEKVT